MARTNARLAKAIADHKAALRDFDRASTAYFRQMERPGEAAAEAKMRTASNRLDEAARAVELAEA